MTYDQRRTGDIIASPVMGDTADILQGAPIQDPTDIPQAAATKPSPAEHAEGMDPEFEQRLQALIGASGGRIRITSGFRSVDQQTRLFAEAVKRYGSETAARKWVAPPGKSNHNHGLAADLSGDLALAHRLAPQFGLVFPMSWEDWHIETIDARDNADPEAYTDPPPGFPSAQDPNRQIQPTEQLAAVVQAMRFGREDQPAIAAHNEEVRAQGAPADAPAPIVAPTAPTPVEPQATSTDAAIASPGAMGDTQKIIEGTPIESQVASVEDVNAAAGAAGVVGNPSGSGRIASSPERQNFATALLTKLGLPVTAENMRFMVAWQQGEGTSAAFNPLATTDHAPGSTAFNDNNGTPVQNFTSFEQGVDTTARTITNGRYADILAALAQGNSAMAAAQALAASPWGTGSLVLRILGGGA